MGILMVKRKNYPEHRAILEQGKLLLVPERKPVHWTELVSVRRWEKRDSDRVIRHCTPVRCWM